MKSDEIVQNVKNAEAVVVADAQKAKGWLKSAWAWAWNTSWKTKAVVIVLLFSSLICFIAIADMRAANYVTRSQAISMFAAHDAVTQNKLDALARRTAEIESETRHVDTRVGVLEQKTETAAASPPPPANITTGSVVHRKRRAPVKSSSSWLSFP